VRCWRICRAKYKARALDGDGAKERPGRWNSLGVPAAYCSSMPSLACLEYLTTVDLQDLPDDLGIIGIHLPEHAVAHVRIDELPGDWRAVPAPESTRAFGDTRLARGRSLAIAVPSVVLPTEDPTIEWNVVINPTHADFARIKTSEPTKIDLSRFLSGEN
jgi:RES domain-containing protein